jgi:hypothetical protein
MQTMAQRLPWMKFYPHSWLSDSVSSCSIGAQGLWLRMMLIMHDSEQYGHLVLDGKPIPPRIIAQRCGVTLKEFRKLFSELLKFGIPAKTAKGIWYSRRMVRDSVLREMDRVRQVKHRKK